MTENKKWFIAWALLFGGCLVISEYIDEKIGWYLTLGFAVVTVSTSNAGTVPLAWLQTQIDKGLPGKVLGPPVPTPNPAGGGAINQ